MKKYLSVLLMICLVSCLYGCKAKTKGFSAEELQDIHTKEATLKQQLVNKTWHFYDEPARAVRYLEDGSYEEYFGQGIRTVDKFSGDDGTWDIRFCGTLDADTKYLEEDKEKALKYYDYNVVVTYINREGKTKTYTLTIEFDNEDLILAGDKLFDGAEVIEHMPEDLGIYEELPGHVWYIDGLDSYALFFKDGYCYMTYGVFADGSTNGSYIYRWGFDESDGIFYLMSLYKPEDVIYEDVAQYYIEGVSPSLKLVDLWSNQTNSFDMELVDGQDTAATALLNSYSSINSWTVQSWQEQY